MTWGFGEARLGSRTVWKVGERGTHTVVSTLTSLRGGDRLQVSGGGGVCWRVAIKMLRISSAYK
jgi:hypothetical protein